ncbi:FAD-dependent thymidylate synthase (plasmid) [Borrelia miyamotoi]|uniref:Flavin-dependent thymidylate synthase n=1 Tax=Borrelia miyamotoi TaxID=47466 RepID=A0ABM6PUM9_9SPIR|nr:FAD-dependent thymidylate synthase [Borrelia miyamotoi]ATQ15404.2 FAD-dependent thymidylate synthase [Borrelia miyamotoi]ATQ15579.2 FAD-dependent thymidylate synthase [Borrelia miyamotoi]ATQ16603.2 FAD-dependent thymidylate synthase [Borrelia miyamotoi]ATQ19007.2 FAD-dependent thymidylate synthase [Borrelia miyamotoi]WDS49192.1 FAD-dependent thymidylate synthase [Borrelia miyamotoi]
MFLLNSVNEREYLLNKEYRVLDKGFIKLIDYMGSDERIVQAARISYRGESIKREDYELIDYLIRNEHTSPFEQVVFTFYVKAPIFIARQWMRHRTARINEVSGSYSLMREEFYVPLVEDIKIQNVDSNQSVNEKMESPQFTKDILIDLEKSQKYCYKLYQDMIDFNVLKEISRIALPLSLYTEWYWQIDLKNLFHFIKLRLGLNETKEVNENSSKEMRDYANILLDVIEKIVPIAAKSFKNHILKGCRFSYEEIMAISGALDTSKLKLDNKALNRLKDKLNIK